MEFVAGIFLLPMLVDSVRHLRQPGTVFEKFQNICRAKKLDAVLRGVAKRLQQPRRDQRRNMAARRSAPQAKNPLSSNVPSFLTGCQGSERPVQKMRCPHYNWGAIL